MDGYFMLVLGIFTGKICLSMLTELEIRKLPFFTFQIFFRSEHFEKDPEKERILKFACLPVKQ